MVAINTLLNRLSQQKEFRKSDGKWFQRPKLHKSLHIGSMGYVVVMQRHLNYRANLRNQSLTLVCPEVVWVLESTTGRTESNQHHHNAMNCRPILHKTEIPIGVVRGNIFRKHICKGVIKTFSETTGLQVV